MEKYTTDTYKNLSSSLKDSIMHSNLSELVEMYIEDKILTGEYGYGDRILETEIAEELGISRGPVREAIQTLDAKGVLDFQPRRGARVGNFVERDFIEILDIRTLIENSILQALLESNSIGKAELEELRSIVDAMHSIDQDSTMQMSSKAFELTDLDLSFHQKLWNMSTSKRRLNILNGMLFQLKLAMQFDLKAIIAEDLLSESIHSHYEILDLIEAGEVKNLKNKIASHIYILKNKKQGN